jgi:hypothetical protein
LTVKAGDKWRSGAARSEDGNEQPKKQMSMTGPQSQVSRPWIR